jgi:hypothetical protein
MVRGELTGNAIVKVILCLLLPRCGGHRAAAVVTAQRRSWRGYTPRLVNRSDTKPEGGPARLLPTRRARLFLCRPLSRHCGHRRLRVARVHCGVHIKISEHCRPCTRPDAVWFSFSAVPSAQKLIPLIAALLRRIDTLLLRWIAALLRRRIATLLRRIAALLRRRIAALLRRRIATLLLLLLLLLLKAAHATSVPTAGEHSLIRMIDVQGNLEAVIKVEDLILYQPLPRSASVRAPSCGVLAKGAERGAAIHRNLHDALLPRDIWVHGHVSHTEP